MFESASISLHFFPLDNNAKYYDSSLNLNDSYCSPPYLALNSAALFSSIRENKYSARLML